MISPGETIVDLIEIVSTESGSQKSSSNRHRSTEYEDIFLGYSRDTLLSKTSPEQRMKNSSPTIRVSDTTPERGIYSKLQKYSVRNMMVFSLGRNHSSWNSLGYDDIRVRLYSLLAMERVISPGIPISKRYLLGTLMGGKTRDLLRKRKKS
jgi:hypothetical protein